MEASLSIRIVARKIPCDSRWRGLGSLLEGNGSLDGGISTNNSDYVPISICPAHQTTKVSKLGGGNRRKNETLDDILLIPARLQVVEPIEGADLAEGRLRTFLV
jgi:hypothetical protein